MFTLIGISGICLESPKALSSAIFSCNFNTRDWSYTSVLSRRGVIHKLCNTFRKGEGVVSSSSVFLFNLIFFYISGILLWPLFLITHYNVSSMLNQLHLWTHTLFIYSLHLSLTSCFGNHLMKMLMPPTDLSCCTSILLSEVSSLYTTTTRRVESWHHDDWHENWINKLFLNKFKEIIRLKK